MADSILHRHYCPQCGQHAHSVHRRFYERLFSLVVPVRRYHCAHCGWSGLIRQGSYSLHMMRWLTSGHPS